MGDTDAGRDEDRLWRGRGVEDLQGHLPEGMTVEAAVDAEGFCQAAGAVEAAGERGERAESAEQDAAGGAGGFGDDVEAFVDTVAEIDVGSAGGAEQDTGAGGEAAAGVSGKVGGAKVGLYFDDAPGSLAVDERFAEKGAGDRNGVAGIEAFGKGNQR
jgi:hypothetical protein